MDVDNLLEGIVNALVSLVRNIDPSIFLNSNDTADDQQTIIIHTKTAKL